MAKLIFALCLFFLALVNTGYALKCYACDSKTKAECNDPFNKDAKIPLNECPTVTAGNEATCLKLTTEDGSETKVKRYCLSYPKSSNACDYVKSQVKNGQVKDCVSCSEDGCNAAGVFSGSTFVMLTACVLSFVNMYARA